MTKDEILTLARQKANDYQLFQHVICAIIEKESDFNTFSYRYEPAFYVHYVEPIFNNGTITITEAHGRSISWGLMQTIGQSVRELGYADWLPGLCDPATGIEWGCRLFAEKLRHAAGNYTQALQLWNGGGNPAYGPAVLALAAKYQ